MPRLKPLRNERLSKKMKLQGKWFSREHYEIGQPYNTFLRPRVFRKPNAERLQQIVGEVEKLVPDFAHASALEIGPGDAPLISTMPFGRKLFVDQSEAILRKLPKEEQRIAGDARQLPIKGQFDLVVANEVFTHLTPRDRKIAIHEMMRHAHSILILDRPIVSLDDVRRFMILQRLVTRGHLRQNRKIEKMLPNAVVIPSVKDLEKKYAEIRRIKTKDKRVLRLEQRELVDFGAIERLLKQKGWVVRTSPIGEKGGYVVLTAHKPQ